MSNTTQLRKLLEEYYNGTASQKQIDRIMYLFANTPDIPSDLEADRKLFEALQTTREGASPLPFDLMPMIDAAIEHKPEKREPARSKRRRIIWLSITGAAASIALIFLVAPLLYNDAVHVDLTPNKPIAMNSHESENVVHEPEHIETQVADNNDIASAVETEKAIANTASVQKPAAVTKAPAKVSNVHVVTDLHEAQEYTMMAFNTLSESMGHVRKTSARVDNKLDNINQTLKNILK